MPAIRTSRSRKAPEGFSEIEETLIEFDNKLKDAEALSSEGKSKNEALWPIYQIHHQRSRYVYDLYYTKEAISSKLYQWLLKSRYADANLIAKWRKQGYENLCCLRCIQAKDNIHGATCICRVPKSQLNGGSDSGSGKPVQCVTCGCRGCSSAD